MAVVQITQEQGICRPPGTAGVQITQEQGICRPPWMAGVQISQERLSAALRAI
jgi:hypothetical protein